MLESLEQALEDAFEGSILRLFHPPVQPVQIAKAAFRQMDRQQTVGLAGPEVPNELTVKLHPSDFERFAPHEADFSRELERHLERLSAERGWYHAEPIRVTLQSDAATSRGRPR